MKKKDDQKMTLVKFSNGSKRALLNPLFNDYLNQCSLKISVSKKEEAKMQPREISIQ